MSNLFVRPTYRQFGVYRKIGPNRAEVIFEGTEEQCYSKIEELREKSINVPKGGTKNVSK